MFRSTLFVAITSLFLIAACTSDEGTDFQIRTSTLTASQTGDQFTATFTGGSVQISATAELIGPENYAIEITVGDGTITALLDAQALQTQISAVTVDGGEFIVDAQSALSLKAFANALFENLPAMEGLGDKVYRVSSLEAQHPVELPIETQVITSELSLRGWTSLCSQMGQTVTVYFDYECKCGWTGCKQCGGSWTEPVGGPNGGDGCFAGCGAGCSVSAYTVDCGAHDGCLNAGYNDYQCLDEFNAAADDFLYAPSC